MYEYIGWAGNILLALCAIPLAVSAYRTKSVSIDWWFLQMWFWGEVLGLVYVASLGADPLVVNYVVNLCCLTIVWYYRSTSAPKEQ